MKKLLLALAFLLLPSAAMAQKTKAALTTEMNTNLASGTDITAATLRATLLDLINSYYDLNGGTSLSCAAHQWVSALPTLSSIACAQPGFSDLAGSIAGAQIPNSTITNLMLANSTISGISLGSNLGTLTFGTHLTGTSYNGSGAVTLATDATNLDTVSTIVARDSSGNFAAGTIMAALTGHASLDLAVSALGTNVQTALGNALNGSNGLVGYSGNIGAATGTSLALGAGSAITSSGPGGALGSNAFSSTSYLPLAGTGGGAMSGPIAMGGYGITGAGASSAVSLALGGASIGSNALAITGTSALGATTVTGSFTATGLVTNADLANPATTVNGVACTLGSTCTITASAGTITAGTTIVTGGPGVLSNSTSGGTLVSSTTLPSGLTIPTPSISGPTFSGTVLGTYTLGGTPSIAGSAINSGTVSGSYMSAVNLAAGNVNGGVTGTLPAGNLPLASSSAKGVVQGDGSTITINGSGVESCTTATTSQVGCVKPDGTTITVSGGVITASGSSATAITVGTTAVGTPVGNGPLTDASGVLGNVVWGQLPGTATNDNAATGNIGEYVSATASSVALTTATARNVVSISLTAGDWDVSASGMITGTGTTTFQTLQAGISTTSATLPSGPDAISDMTYAVFTALYDSPTNIPATRISIAATTTVYYVAYATFSVSTATVSGFLRARRVR